MSYNDLEFDLDLSPILATREAVQATVHFVVGGGTHFSIALLIPFVNMHDAEQEIRQALFVESDAIANRWGLQFASADAALNPSAYESLTVRLSAIASPDFTVRKVLVRRIIPLSARVAPPPPLPPPPPAKPTFTDKVLQPVVEAIPAFKAMKQLEQTIKESESELYNDPHLGGVSTARLSASGVPITQDGRLRRMFDVVYSRILEHGSSR